jgi:hypothetical protein
MLEAAGMTPHPRMSGVSFLRLLKGEPYASRKHVFFERGPHGRAPVSIEMSSSGYDLSRGVRSDRYKFICNCTPWIHYAPVDSAGGAAWQQIRSARDRGELSNPVSATYFTSPRPVYELYDMEEDPSELNNLSGRPGMAGIERGLRAALVEKMVLDFDYLPLPALQARKGGSLTRTRSLGADEY